MKGHEGKGKRCMKKLYLFTFVVVCLFTKNDLCAQTYYYERVAVVENGQKKSSSGDGHFITFTGNGCYDSDKAGMSENTYFREYKRTSDGIKNYYGDSYFGKAYYYFSSDLSRLNVKVEESGKTYVYTRTNAPSGITKSSRSYTSSSSISGMTPMVVPPIVTAPVTTTSGGTSSSSVSPRTCKGCNGTGQCTACKGTGLAAMSAYYTDNHTMIRNCAVCNGRRTCGVCHGKGTL